MIQKADPKTVRATNRSLILRTIYHGHADTRSDISKVTGLTRTAVSDVVLSLIEDGLIEEIGRRSGLLGKPARILGMPKNARNLIGIQLEVGFLKGVITDLRGNIIHCKEIRLRSTDIRQAINGIKRLTHELEQYSNKKILGLGISSPGIINSNTGTIKFAANLGWHDVPLIEQLGNLSNYPIHLANDTSCAGLSEILFGSGRGVQRVCTIVVEAGVGAGLFFSDAQCMDVTNGSAEIGHLKIRIDPSYFEGQKKEEYLIEELLGSQYLCNRLLRIAQYTQKQELLEIANNPFEAIKIKQLASAGCNEAKKFIEETGLYLGKGIAVLVNLMHPDIVIVNGTIRNLGEEMFLKAIEVVKTEAIEEYVRNLKIVPSNFEHTVVLGAACLLLRNEMDLI